MSKKSARIFLTLPLVLLFAGSQPQSASARQTASTQRAENKCVRQSVACLKKCEEYYHTPEGRQPCEKRCTDKVNNCLNNIKAISVDPATQKQTVKQNPAAAGQTTSNKGGAEKLKHTPAAAGQTATPTRGGTDKQRMQSGKR